MKLTRYRNFHSFSNQPGVRLLAAENERFKTVRVLIYLMAPIQQRIATEHSLLARVLRVGSVNHPTRRELSNACEELYGAHLSISISRMADVQALTAAIDFPADRFLPKGSKELEGAINLLVETLTRPALDPNQSALRAEVVAHEKSQHEDKLRAMQDDKPAWAALLATKRTYAGTPAAIHEYGEVADLAAITPKSLFERHQSLIGNARVLAFVTGPVRPEHALKVLSDKLELPRTRRAALPPAVKLKNRRAVQRSRAKAETEQTHLVFTWSGGDVFGGKGFAAMLYADALLGGYGMSRLFKVVREEHGLAYAVSSMYHRARGSIVAQAAVDTARAEKAVRLIRSEFKRLVTKGFTDAEFDAVRESLIEARKSAYESQGALEGDAAFQEVLGIRKSLEQQFREIRKTSPSMVRAMLKKLKPHSEFRLG